MSNKLLLYYDGGVNKASNSNSTDYLFKSLSFTSSSASSSSLTISEVDSKLDFNAAILQNLSINTSGDLTAANVKATSYLQVANSCGSAVKLQAPGMMMGDIVLTLPGTVGTNSQALVSDGCGTLSWMTVTSSLDGLTDVTITSAADGHVIVYDGSEWVNEAPLQARTLTCGSSCGSGSSASWGSSVASFSASYSPTFFAAGPGSYLIGGTYFDCSCSSVPMLSISTSGALGSFSSVSLPDVSGSYTFSYLRSISWSGNLGKFIVNFQISNGDSDSWLLDPTSAIWTNFNIEIDGPGYNLATIIAPPSSTSGGWILAKKNMSTDLLLWNGAGFSDVTLPGTAASTNYVLGAAGEFMYLMQLDYSCSGANHKVWLYSPTCSYSPWTEIATVSPTSGSLDQLFGDENSNLYAYSSYGEFWKVRSASSTTPVKLLAYSSQVVSGCCGSYTQAVYGMKVSNGSAVTMLGTNYSFYQTNDANLVDSGSSSCGSSCATPVVGLIKTNSQGYLDSTFLQYDIDLGTHRISNVVDPSSAQDAATKNYVDGRVTLQNAYERSGQYNMCGTPATLNTSSMYGAVVVAGSEKLRVSTSSGLAVGCGSDYFEVNSSGDLSKIKGVTYSWPSAVASSANSALVSDSCGSLSWTQLSFSGLSDVDLTSAASGQILRYDGSSWVNESALDVYTASSGSGLSDRIIKTNSGGLLDQSFLQYDIDFGGHILSGVSAPVADTDAANKAYVDGISAGLTPKEAAKAATTAALAGSYSAGVITATSSGALSLDGVSLSAGDRVLVKDQASAAQNGIYSVTNAGSGGSQWVLTRASDFDSSSEIRGGCFVFVQAGEAHGSQGWVVISTSEISIGSSAINWTQFSELQVTNGDGSITITGNDIAVASAGIATANLQDSAVTSEKIADGAIGSSKLAAGAVDSTALADGSVTSGKLAAGAVDSTALGAGSVGETALADDSVTSAKIADGAVGSSELASGAVTGDKLSLLENSSAANISQVWYDESGAIATKAVQSVSKGTGYSLSVGDIVYVNNFGQAVLASYDDLSSMFASLGIVVQNATSSASSVLIMSSGLVESFSGLSVGQMYFLSSSGSISVSSPNALCVVEIGRAISSTKLVFAPRPIVVLT